MDPKPTGKKQPTRRARRSRDATVEPEQRKKDTVDDEEDLRSKRALERNSGLVRKPRRHNSITKTHDEPVNEEQVRVHRGRTFTPKQAEAANKFVYEVSALGIEGLVEEFKKEVQNYSPPNLKYEAFTANEAKNRYKDVVCLDDTRVVLTLNVPPESDYIHANYVKLEGYDTKKFIATQGPMENTIQDFWRMVYEAEATSIVMLCDMLEDGKVKCAQYFPEKPGDYITYGAMFVNNKKKFIQDGLTMFAIEVLPDGCSNSVIVRLITIPDWPDRGAPNSALRVLRLLRSIPNGMCVIHCSAGIGRTGTVMTLEFLMYSFMKKQELPQIKDLIKNIRNQRASCVQTPAQYLYIVAVFMEYIGIKLPGKKERDMVNKFKKLYNESKVA